MALANRKLVRSGGDPLSKKRRAEGVPTFAEAAERVLEHEEWRLARPVARTELVAEHGTVRVPSRRPPARLRGQHGRRVGDPHAHLARDDGQGGPSARPLSAGVGGRHGPAERQPVRSGGAGPGSAERHRDAPAGAAAQGRGRGHRDGAGRPGAAGPPTVAFEFLVLTAARSGEVRLATWDETDTAGAVRTVPAARIEAKREHRVPLCGRALEVLDAARPPGDGNRLVFPMRSGRSIATSTLPKMLQYHEVAAVPHGFRSSFRDWAAEETDHPREVIEAALAQRDPEQG